MLEGSKGEAMRGSIQSLDKNVDSKEGGAGHRASQSIATNFVQVKGNIGESTMTVKSDEPLARLSSSNQVPFSEGRKSQQKTASEEQNYI